jgi:hypothetical protein
MDRDAGNSDRSEEAQQGDTGMIGSETEEPGPGRDTSLTDPDPVAASTDQPRGTVAMSPGDPMRTRLGSHVEGAGAIGYDVAAAEEGAAQETPPEDRPGYEPERTADPGVRGAAFAGQPVEDVGPSDRAAFTDEPAATGRSPFATEDAGATDRSTLADDPGGLGAGGATAGPGPAGYGGQPGGAGAAGYEGEPGGAGLAGYEREPGGAGMAANQGEPGQDVPATYTGEEAEVTGRPEYAERTEGGDQPLYQEEVPRADRPGGGGSLFTDEEPERLDRPGPQEPGVQQGVYDQEADRARRPSDGR